MSPVEMSAMSKKFLKTSTMEGWKVEIACIGRYLQIPNEEESEHGYYPKKIVCDLSLSLSLSLSLVVICNTFLALSLKEIESY
jgi:hypothetical protein